MTPPVTFIQRAGRVVTEWPWTPTATAVMLLLMVIHVAVPPLVVLFGGTLPDGGIYDSSERLIIAGMGWSLAMYGVRRATGGISAPEPPAAPPAPDGGENDGEAR